MLSGVSNQEKEVDQDHRGGFRIKSPLPIARKSQYVVEDCLGGDTCEAMAASWPSLGDLFTFGGKTGNTDRPWSLEMD